MFVHDFIYNVRAQYCVSHLISGKVMTGLDEAEGRITAVRHKFERQLQRLRERERLVEVSRQDCQKEEEALLADRARHREQMEKVKRCLSFDAVELKW